jgi:hypothetical protein
MKTAISTLISLDIHRDGGSLSATFADQLAVQHTLMLPVKSRKTGDEVRLQGYAQPILETYEKTPRISPVTGTVNYETNRQEREIPWSEARRIIDQFQSLLHQVSPEDTFIYSAMVKASNSDGSCEVGA